MIKYLVEHDAMVHLYIALVVTAILILLLTH